MGRECGIGGNKRMNLTTPSHNEVNAFMTQTAYSDNVKPVFWFVAEVRLIVFYHKYTEVSSIK